MKYTTLIFLIIILLVTQDLLVPLDSSKNKNQVYRMPNTVKHFLIECGVLAYIRGFFIANNIKDLSENVYMYDILYILREIKIRSTVI